jgi:hypothetical protein
MSEQREWITDARGVPIREAPTFDPGVPWICSTCGGWIYPQRPEEHRCLERRPTYDELALAILAFRCARSTADIEAQRIQDYVLLDLARRLEPGP